MRPETQIVKGQQAPELAGECHNEIAAGIACGHDTADPMLDGGLVGP